MTGAEVVDGDAPVVRLEQRGHVLLVQMDRPAKHNALDARMTEGLDAALNQLEDDPLLWVGVLSGTPQMFCAGTDLKLGAGEPTVRGGPYGVVRRDRSKPLVAAVEGGAYGGGLELVLACDLVVAARDAVFALPEVSRGVIATCGGLFRATQTLPLNIAKELLLTGDPLSAERAHTLGLVNLLTDPGEALPAAMALAERIVANSPTSVQATLRAVAATTGRGDELGWAATEEATAVVLASADSREGVAAFLERRPPRWTGA